MSYFGWGVVVGLFLLYAGIIAYIGRMVMYSAGRSGSELRVMISFFSTYIVAIILLAIPVTYILEVYMKAHN